MKVKDRMTKDPVTVEPGIAVDEALGIMRSHGVRHLPVMQHGRIVGMVTDNELRTAWFPSLLDDLVVGDVMATDPITVEADESVYQAARIIYHNKLTGLLVSQDGRLVGIITLADILGLFVDMLGLLEDSRHLDVALRKGASSLEEVYTLLAGMGVEVLSVALASSDPQNRVYSLRLATEDLQTVRAALRNAGHNVLD